MAFKPYSNKAFLGEFDEGKEPRRYNSFEDIIRTEKQIPAEQADPLIFPKLTENLNIRQNFGLVLDEDGNAPSTDGVPRAFIMGRDANGREKMMDLQEAGIKFGSKEFWKQAQLGNAFVYPAGEVYPVQIKLSLSGPTSPTVSFSKLIEPSQMPVPERKAPSRFQQFLFRMNKRLASAETRQYYQSLEDDKANKAKFNEIAEKRVRGAGKEIKELRELEVDLAADAEQQELEERATEAEQSYQTKLDGHKTYRNLTAPEPVFDESIKKIPGEKFGLYTADGFSKLQKLDAKISDYKVGGEQISDDAYMGLVASCSLDPKNGENIFKSGQEYDPNLIQALEPLGVTKEFFTSKYPSAHMSFTYIDFLDHNTLRDGEDNQFESSVNAGRKDAVKLLKDYQNNEPGSKKNLAEAITRGIRETAKLSGADKATLSNQFMKAGRIMSASAELLEKDPELKTIAMKECGLKERDLLAIKGMGVVDKADMNAADATRKIAKAAAYDDTLTREQRKELAVDVITSRLMSEKLLKESKLNLKSNKAYNDFANKISELREDALLNGRVAPPSPNRPLPPPGKLYFEQVTSYQNIMAEEYLTIPDTAVELGKGAENNYRELAKHIVEKDGLDNLDSRELDAKLNDPSAYKDASILEKGNAAAQEIREQKQAEKQAQAEKQLGTEKQNIQPEKASINDRAKMFEQKAPKAQPKEELQANPSENIKQRAAMFGPVA